MKPANLFFVELIIVLLFFSISSAVILRVFAAADSKQRNTVLTERSIICAQSVAEAYSVSGELDKALETVFGEDAALIDGSSLLLDESFRPSENGGIALTLNETKEQGAAGTLSELNITFSDGNTELYSLACAAYIPLNGGAADE